MMLIHSVWYVSISGFSYRPVGVSAMEGVGKMGGIIQEDLLPGLKLGWGLKTMLSW